MIILGYNNKESWNYVFKTVTLFFISGLRGFSGSKRSAEKKRFLLYCGYAWGVPVLLVILVTALTVAPNVSRTAWYSPGIGDGRCWFRSKSSLSIYWNEINLLGNCWFKLTVTFTDELANLLYFYGPMGLIISFNVVLFGITTWKIKEIQKDTAMLKKQDSRRHATYETDKQR